MDADSDVALDILITNVVCVFRTRCHLNLRKIALEGANVIYKRDVGVSIRISWCPIQPDVTVRVIILYGQGICEHLAPC